VDKSGVLIDLGCGYFIQANRRTDMADLIDLD
jgi:hypothetical protein